MTIAALTILGLMAGTGYLVSWIELGSVRAHTRGLRAYHLAEAGLAEAFASPGRPPAGARTYTQGTGSATVTFTRLLDLPGGSTVYDVSSVGATASRGTTVIRTVRQAAWAGDPPSLDAALSVSSTAGSGVGSGSATGYVTGYPPPGCARPAGPGIATGAPVSTGAISVTGAPPVWPPPAAVTTGDRTGLRWPDLSNRAIRAPDAIVPGDPWPTAGPAWPHIRLTTSGPLGPGHSGQGVIVATGDLNVASGFAWRGAILVGGSLRLFGDADLTGAVFVGLAGAAAAADLGDGHVRITYDPCSADLATASLAPFPAALPGTWRGDW